MLKLFLEEHPHVVGSDTGKHRRIQPQPRSPNGDVSGTASQVPAETLGVFQGAMDLVCIKIDRNPAHADQV
jgi:hypothetical protein